MQDEAIGESLTLRKMTGPQGRIKTRLNKKFGKLFKSNKKKKQKQRRKNWQWRSQPTCTKDIEYKVIDGQVIAFINRLEEDQLIEREIGEYALLAREPGDKQYEESTYLADTGASMHMTGNPEGLFDCKDINEPVILGSGKHLVATKIGKVRKTVLQL